MYCLKKLRVYFLHINNLFAKTCCSRSDKAQVHWAVHVQPKNWFRTQTCHKMILIHFLKKSSEKTNLKGELHNTTHCWHYRDPHWAFLHAQEKKLCFPDHSKCLHESQKLQVSKNVLSGMFMFNSKAEFNSYSLKAAQIIFNQIFNWFSENPGWKWMCWTSFLMLKFCFRVKYLNRGIKGLCN